MDQSVIVLWIGSGSLLLRAVDLFNIVDDYAKGCYMRTA
jgi:hypothetical protein